MSRKSKGRQKLEMVRISKESNLLVTFSKRRYGVFKKACELSTLCGAEIAVIVFSPGKKVFSFGHPSVHTVLQRYLSTNPPQMSGSQQLLEAHRNARVCDLNAQLTQIENELEMETKRGQEMDRVRKLSQAQNWWESPIEELNLAQLEQLKASLEMLRHKVANQVEEMLIIQTTNNPAQFFAPNSSSSTRVLHGGFNTNMMPNYQNPRLGFGNGFF